MLQILGQIASGLAFGLLFFLFWFTKQKGRERDMISMFVKIVGVTIILFILVGHVIP